MYWQKVVFFYTTRAYDAYFLLSLTLLHRMPFLGDELLLLCLFTLCLKIYIFVALSCSLSLFLWSPLLHIATIKSVNYKQNKVVSYA